MWCISNNLRILTIHDEQQSIFTSEFDRQLDLYIIDVETFYICVQRKRERSYLS